MPKKGIMNDSRVSVPVQAGSDRRCGTTGPKGCVILDSIIRDSTRIEAPVESTKHGGRLDV